MPFITVDTGNSLYYDFKLVNQASTSKQALTVLLLHGLGSSHVFYEGILPSLLKTSRPLRIVRIDTEGSGLSVIRDTAAQAAKDGQFGVQSIPGIAQQAIGLLQRLLGDEKETQEVIVVGHSMSGITACELAIASPWKATEHGPAIKVAGGVLIGPVVPSSQVADMFKGRIETVRKGGMLPMADMVPYKAIGSKGTALHSGFIRSLICGQDPVGYISLCNCIASAEVPAYQTLSKGCPMLIIAGEEDKSAPLQGCQYIQNQIGDNCELKVLNGVGHWHCIEAPEEVGEIIYDFIQKI